MVIILTSWGTDFFAAGYFNDKDEQDAFTNWRLEEARKEAKCEGRTLPIIFMIQEKDAKTYLDMFRKRIIVPVDHVSMESTQNCQINKNMV